MWASQMSTLTNITRYQNAGNFVVAALSLHHSPRPTTELFIHASNLS